MGAERSLKSAEAIFLALLTIGLIGLLFLIIYGNLSGNLGWTQDSSSYVNETITLTNTTGVTPAGAQNRVDGSLSSVVMTNATNESYIISTGNYTVTGVLFNSTVNSAFMDKSVNVSYTVTYDSQADINSEAVITNLTAGATQFFTFSGVWFILTAITILIGIVLGVLALVKKTSSGGMAGNKSRSEFVS